MDHVFLHALQVKKKNQRKIFTLKNVSKVKPWLINSLNNNFILIKLLEKQLEKQITYDQT